MVIVPDILGTKDRVLLRVTVASSSGDERFLRLSGIGWCVCKWDSVGHLNEINYKL